MCSLSHSSREAPPTCPTQTAAAAALDVVGLLVGDGEQVVSADVLADPRPRASPAAQEGPAHHGEDAASPADKHRLTKLDAKRARVQEINGQSSIGCVFVASLTTLDTSILALAWSH